MAWRHLTEQDMRKILSEDELEKLKTLSLDSSVSAVVQDSIDLVSNMFRGAFEAKGYPMDTRDAYVPMSYELPVLQYARYVAWTRFPNSPDIALDDARKDEVKRLTELLKNPYIGAEQPEWEHSSKNPDNPDVPRQGGSYQTGSIKIPYMRFNESFYWWNALSAL